MKEEIIFLEIAKIDLLAAKYLLSQHLYSHSIFHLQQAVEKSIKYFGISQKIISIDEAKKNIGHDTWKLYLKIFRECESRIIKLEEFFIKSKKVKEASLIKNLNWLFKSRNNIQKYEQMFNFSTEDLFDISLSNEQLQTIIDEIQKVNENLKKAVSTEIVKEGEMSEYRRKVYELLDVIANVNPNINKNIVKKELDAMITLQLVTSLFETLKEYIIKLAFCSVCLFYLSIIFSPHYVRSRYPEDGLNPLEIYTTNMPLVQKLEYFINLIEGVITDLEYISQVDILKLVM
jgi:HEPN domain-containing protein